MFRRVFAPIQHEVNAMPRTMKALQLDAGRIHQTIEQLALRIDARFPESSLSNVCRRLEEISKDTGKTVQRIRRPLYLVRISTVLLGAGFVGLLVFLCANLRFHTISEFEEAVQISEAAINVMILLALGFVYLGSLELRVKRNRVVSAINRLRDVAHVIDMHQLTKDPDGQTLRAHITPVSPRRSMTPFELWRYLDYCSEMLSLSSKLGYLYVSSFHDPVATAAANELETLSTGLARKIWQKIMILHNERDFSACDVRETEK